MCGHFFAHSPVSLTYNTNIIGYSTVWTVPVQSLKLISCSILLLCAACPRPFIQLGRFVCILTRNEIRFRARCYAVDTVKSSFPHTKSHNAFDTFTHNAMSHRCALAVCTNKIYKYCTHCPVNLNGIIYALSSNRYQLPPFYFFSPVAFIQCRAQSQ